ncbi:chitin disaccharide deacetylase [Virgibacillus oceani]|uniref:Carbohydrate deacetylase n=1 Tax=Virgibacillus oceani TaxID=1479511 RepID=A0A917HCR5_9BACI|nr:chitin disaccharide deacetylase [Virgibacillus oceani]GGG73697.1 carbohydrate deacetylase [Virgibacillus oceani]
MRVLFNADDFGLTKGITDGIMESHINGVVGSATLMMNGHAVDYTVALAKKHPALKVGIHLVLTWGKPLSDDVPDLVDDNGLFKYKNTFREMDPPNVEQVEKEWRAQIDAFLETGLALHHIDSHHHVHGWEPLRELVVKLAKDYGVPVRYVETLKENHEILLADALWLDFYGDGVNADIFTELQQLSVDSVEVMTHPAIIDDELRQVSSYVEKREEERKILCGMPVPRWVELCR